MVKNRILGDFDFLHENTPLIFEKNFEKFSLKNAKYGFLPHLDILTLYGLESKHSLIFIPKRLKWNIQVTIEGEVLAKEIGDQRINHFILPNSTDDGTIQNCRVEDVALHYFLNQREFDEGVLFYTF